MTKNKKIDIRCYGVLALLFSFLTFGVFKSVDAAPQGSFIQSVPNPTEIELQNRINPSSILSRIWSGIIHIASLPIRFFRWLFGCETTTVVEAEEQNPEEEDGSETSEVHNTGNSIDPLPTHSDQPIEIIEEEESGESSDGNNSVNIYMTNPDTSIPSDVSFLLYPYQDNSDTVENNDSDKIEEEDKTEIPTVPTIGSSLILNTLPTDVSTAIHDVQEIMENKNAEEEIEEEEEDKD